MKLSSTVQNQNTTVNGIIHLIKRRLFSIFQEEIRFLKGEEEDRGPLTEDERLRLRSKIEGYINAGGSSGSSDQADGQGPELLDTKSDGFSVGASMMHIRAAFAIFKEIVAAERVKERTTAPSPSGLPHDSSRTPLAQHGQQNSQDENTTNAQMRKMKFQVCIAKLRYRTGMMSKA